MKKQKKQFLILVVLCLVCVGGYFVIRNLDLEEEAAVSVTITDFATEDVTELSMTGDHELHFVKTDDVWTETSLPEEAIDQSSVTMLLSELAGLTTEETVIESPESLAEYGLEEPYRTINITFSDESAMTLLVGNKSELLSKYYLKVDGRDAVYLVSTYIVTDFDKTAEEFIAAEEDTETATEVESGADVTDGAAGAETESEGESDAAAAETETATAD